jgi:hypothetical protein
MPGYLSSRLVAFLPASQSDVTTINTTIVEMQGDIEDLQLGISV